MQQYPTLYNIVRRKNQTVDATLSTTPLNIYFRRSLVGDKPSLWLELVSKVQYLWYSQEGVILTR